MEYSEVRIIIQLKVKIKGEICTIFDCIIEMLVVYCSVYYRRIGLLKIWVLKTDENGGIVVKQFAKGMKRSIAMLLAVVMVLSLMPAGLISLTRAEGAEGDFVHLSDLLIKDENYGGKLAALEKIIRSGMLKAEKQIAYEQPKDGIIEVDSAAKKITAKESNGWIPVSADIMVGTEKKETVKLTDGEGTYTYAGNAFSVVVSYELYLTVDKDAQLALMNAAYYMAQDNANVNVLRDGIVEQILAELVAENAELKNAAADIELDGYTAVDLINQLATTGIELPALTLGGKTTTLKFLEDVSESVDDAADLLADKNDDGMLALYGVLLKYGSLSNLELLDIHSAELIKALKSNYDSINALAYDEYGLAYVLKRLSKYNADAVDAIADAKTELADKKSQLEELKNNVAQLRATKAQLQEARAKLDEAKALVNTYDTNKAQLDAQLIETFGHADYAQVKALIATFGDPTGGKLTQAIAYVEEYADEAETARTYINTYEPQLIAAEQELAKAEAEADALLQEQGMSLATVDQDIADAEKQIADAEAYIADAETNLLPKLVEVEGALDTLIKALKKFCTTAAPAYECSWNVVDMDILAEGLTTDQYTQLNKLVDALESTELFTADDVKDQLYAATTQVQHNMSMFNVNIELVVYKLDGKVNSNNLIVSETVTGKVTLEKGADQTAILAAIQNAGVKAQSDLTNYADAILSVLPETLTEDITYTIEYYPNVYAYEIVADGNKIAADTVYHGYQLKLPAYIGEEEQVYEYNVGGMVYSQNEIVKITEAITITRTQGKPRTAVLLKDMLAGNLTGGLSGNGAVYNLTEKAQNILKSAALISDDIRVRVPGADAQIEYVGTDVVVSGYSSDHNGLYWVPVSVDFINESNNKVNVEVKDGKAAIPTVDFAKISVNYALTTDFTNSEVLEMLNLPLQLVDEYNAQKAALAILDAKYSALGQLNKSKVNMLVTVANDKNLGDEICGAAESIRDDCLDTDGNLKLYNLLTGYRAEGMVYYYRNYNEFVDQTQKLTAALEVLWGDADNQAALLTVMYEYADVLGMTNEQIESYIEPLGLLLEALREMELVAPNEAVDLESDDLEALVNTIAAAGEVTGFEGTFATPVLYAAVGKNAANYTSVEVRVYVDGKLIVLPESIVSSLTYKLDNQTQSYVITANDLAAIQAMVEAVQAYAKDNAAYDLDTFYSCAVSGKVPVQGDVITSAQNIIYNYTAKEYTVAVEGADDQIISVNTSLKVSLPASGTNTMLYEYMVDGVKVSAGTYTFTTEQLARLFANGSYTVTRIATELDPVGDALQGVVDSMNGGDVKVELESTKQADGTYNYVMDMYIPTSVMNNPAAMNQVGMALFGSYTYIEINDEMLLNGTSMYVQALLNAVMDSGLSGKTLQDIAANNGGLLMSSKLTMGVSSSDENMVTTTLNIYLEGDSAELDQVADALAYFGNYVTITCTEGGLVMDLNLPEKAYQAYLAAMLVLSQRDLKNINEMDGKVALGYILDVMDPVLSDPNLDLATFTNTLALLGYSIDGSEFEPYFDRMVALYNSLNWNYDENGIATTLTGREGAVNLMKEKLGSLGTMVKDEEIYVNITLNVTNLEIDYEAAYLDISAEKISNKVGMIGSLADKTFAGKAVIVLLSDVGSANAPVALQFADTTIIDLNGYTIYGDLTSTNGTVYLVDSSLEQKSEGGVTGMLSGKVVITAGTYAQDVTANLKPGYTQDENGTVKNTYYTIEKDAEGNYTVTLNADAVDPEMLPDVKALALDMLFDLAINGYANGALSIGGCQIYDIAIEDVVGLYLGTGRLDSLLDDAINGTAAQNPWINVSDLAKLYNMLVADLTNFENIASGDYLAKYDITTAPWEIYVYVDGDHISADLGALNSETKTTTITVVLSDDEVADEVRDLAGELSNVVEIESELEMSQNKDGNDITIDAIYKESSVVIDLATDSNYIFMLGTLLADVVSDPTGLQEGLNILEAHGTTNTLKAAIDKCTINDVLKAVENVDRGYDFSKLGALSETYKEVLLVTGAVLRRLDIDRGNRTLGSLETEYATYTLDKENLSISKSADAKSYNVTVNALAPYVSVTVILCDACPHADPVQVPANDATCTEAGNIAYWYCPACGVCFEDEACTRMIAKEDTVIPASGHSYEVSWTWAEDYSSATAEFTCANCDVSPSYAKDAQIDSNITKNPTCSKEGTVIYTAGVVFNSTEYTDSREVTLEKLEHTYTSAPTAWNWTADYSGAKVTFVCDLCKEDVIVDAVVTKAQTDASCTVDGKIVYTATVADSNGVIYTAAEELPLIAPGHSYKVSWTWAEDYSSAKAAFTCANCEDVNDVLDAAVTTNGNGVYVATVTYFGVVYVDIRTEEHSFVLDGWTWADDYSQATAHFTCSSCGEKLDVDVSSTSETTPATCAKEGETVYNATLTLNGQAYTDIKSVTIPKAEHALQHTAGNGATCTENGNIEYWYCTACGSYFANEACTEEIELSDTVITAPGHSYTAEPTWAWSEDNTGAVAKFVCGTCGHIHYEQTTVTSTVTGPSCTEAGKTVYAAAVTFGGKRYTGTKEVAIPATGHTYVVVENGWEWSEDHLEAAVTVECHCGDTHTMDALVSIKTVEPTFEVAGSKTYTAIAFWNGQQFTATYVVDLEYRLSIDNVTVDTDKKIVGTKVTDDGFIYLDVQPSGITQDDLLKLLWVEYEADRLTVSLTNSKKDASLICNGSVLKLTAANKDGHVEEKTYVIIILGDVNGNGRIEVADTSLIAATRVGTSTVELSKYALLAADLNGNGGLDVADAAKNANKVVYWDSYKSQM